MTVRVRFAGDRTARAARRTVGRLNAFRPALASWYGPGLYGNALGCGGRLSPGTIGVAHKSLPCGTKLDAAQGLAHRRAPASSTAARTSAPASSTSPPRPSSASGFGSTGTVWVAH